MITSSPGGQVEQLDRQIERRGSRVAHDARGMPNSSATPCSNVRTFMPIRRAWEPARRTSSTASISGHRGRFRRRDATGRGHGFTSNPKTRSAFSFKKGPQT